MRKRQFPIVGSGDGVSFFIHLDDAAAATVLAFEQGATGIYNVVDDEPAPIHDWLPERVERQGEARAGLDASLRELARGFRAAYGHG